MAAIECQRAWIGRRLYLLRHADELRRTNTNYEGLRPNAIQASIIADWNAALEAMRAVVAQAIITYANGVRECIVCDCDLVRWGHDDLCTIPDLLAAIARMEGDDEHD